MVRHYKFINEKWDTKCIFTDFQLIYDRIKNVLCILLGPDGIYMYFLFDKTPIIIYIYICLSVCLSQSHAQGEKENLNVIPTLFCFVF